MRTFNPSEQPEGSLRRKLRSLFVFCAIALVGLAIGIAAAARTLTGSLGQVETEATRQKAKRVYRAFEADLRQLFISNRD